MLAYGRSKSLTNKAHDSHSVRVNVCELTNHSDYVCKQTNKRKVFVILQSIGIIKLKTTETIVVAYTDRYPNKFQATAVAKFVSLLFYTIRSLMTVKLQIFLILA